MITKIDICTSLCNKLFDVHDHTRTYMKFCQVSHVEVISSISITSKFSVKIEEIFD